MYYDIPTDPKKIKARIRSYERKLQIDMDESKRLGFPTGDGYGKRYLLPPLYLLIGDVEGAIKSYEWLNKWTPDDSGNCFLNFCMILAFYKTGKIKKAILKIFDVIFKNIYVIPFFLEGKPIPSNAYVYDNRELKPFAVYIPKEYINLWDVKETEWLRNIYNNEEVQKAIKEYVDFMKNDKQNMSVSDFKKELANYVAHKLTHKK